MNTKKRIILLTGQQWVGLVVLMVLALATWWGLSVLPHSQQPETTVLTDSTAQVLQIHQNQMDSMWYGKKRKVYPKDTITIYRHTFDPNTADSITLLRQGLRPWQVRNLLRYRAKGGMYKKPQDMKRLYGMTDSLYQLMESYIQIDTVVGSIPSADSISTDSLRTDSTRLHWQIKKDTILNIRTVDTAELKMIRGIGSYRAREIVRRRQALGGYVSVEQLMEIPALQSLNKDSLLCHFYIDTVIVQRIGVNHASIAQLQRHPYISFEQAKAIYQLRRKKIRLKSMDELSKLPEFSASDRTRLQPYLEFEEK